MSTEDTGDDWAAAMAEQAIEEAQAVELEETRYHYGYSCDHLDGSGAQFY